jgi:hypothetical protein
VYTQCGRHTDQFLFGGHSLSDLWKRKDKDKQDAAAVAQRKSADASAEVVAEPVEERRSSVGDYSLSEDVQIE